MDTEELLERLQQSAEQGSNWRVMLDGAYVDDYITGFQQRKLTRLMNEWESSRVSVKA